VLLPTDTDARLVLGMVKAAFAPAGGFDELQEALLQGIARSLYGYTGVVADTTIAKKWFQFPGERHGIYELGARHDWVHVLAGYETTSEGELDVFAFIAASMHDERGLVLLAITLGLFQNGSICHVAGKRIANARSDTLTDDGAVDRFTEALRRGNRCTTDVMGSVDMFARKDEPLDAVREQFGVVPIRPGR
jgi:hypothetical protein